MVYKNLSILVLWTKVASAFEGLKLIVRWSLCLREHESVKLFVTGNSTSESENFRCDSS